MEEQHEQVVDKEDAFAQALAGEQEPGKAEEPSLTNPCREKKTPQQLATAVRKHLKLGKTATEIMAIENCSRMQYRYAVRLLGKFPGGNEEAFAQFQFAMQARLDDLDKGIDAALRMGEFASLANMTRVAATIHVAIYDMAMKLGVAYKVPDKVEVTERKRYDVGFGDEETAVKPAWPKQHVPTQVQ
jgi:hypothetical protein